MDILLIIFGVGLVFTGFVIGYPLGHVFGKREAFHGYDMEPTVVRNARQRITKHRKCFCLECQDVLNAEVVFENAPN